MSKSDEAILKIIPMKETYNNLRPEEKDVEIYKGHLIDEINRVCNQHIKTQLIHKNLGLNNYQDNEKEKIKFSMVAVIEGNIKKRFAKYKSSEIDSINFDYATNDTQKKAFKKVVTDVFNILDANMKKAIKMLEEEMEIDKISTSKSSVQNDEITKQHLRKLKEELEKKYQTIICINPDDKPVRKVAKTKKLNLKNDAGIVAKTLMDNFQVLSNLIANEDEELLAQFFISEFNKNIENGGY